MSHEYIIVHSQIPRERYYTSLRIPGEEKTKHVDLLNICLVADDTLLPEDLRFIKMDRLATPLGSMPLILNAPIQDVKNKHSPGCFLYTEGSMSTTLYLSSSALQEDGYLVDYELTKQSSLIGNFYIKATVTKPEIPEFCLEFHGSTNIWSFDLTEQKTKIGKRVDAIAFSAGAYKKEIAEIIDQLKKLEECATNLDAITVKDLAHDWRIPYQGGDKK